MQSMYEMFQTNNNTIKRVKEWKYTTTKINKLSRSVIGKELSSVSVFYFWMLKARNFHSVPDNCESVIPSKKYCIFIAFNKQTGIERLYAANAVFWNAPRLNVQDIRNWKNWKIEKL